jgi:hydrogenase maturation protein HypF
MNNGRQLRLRVIVQGAVQGVGFRPFIYKLAARFALHGCVKNSPQGVFIEVEGHKDSLENFLVCIEPEKPPRASIHSLEPSFLDPIGYTNFSIIASDKSGEKSAPAMPDIATCSDCLREIQDPANRRYRYPFTNCTNCGPRFTIMGSLPYDRPNTSMKHFKMCLRCLSEYEDPLDRRFHAQPNACPECGPHLELWDREGALSASHDEALLKTADSLKEGAIIAVKGLGGFHIMTSATNDTSINLLRQRKHHEKPFALMFPDLWSVSLHCEISPVEKRLLESPEAPIVILKYKNSSQLVSNAVAPGNPYLGVMMPYTPLHHLLMAELKIPVVATSGNLAEETLCTDEKEALERLGGIADRFLIHNRPILRHMDDSIARIIMGRELILRRARGYAPLPVYLQHPLPPLLAVGGQMKNTVAVSAGNKVFLSQHIGDLGSTQSFHTFTKTIESFARLYDQPPAGQIAILCDAHPDYVSTRFANEMGPRCFPVQHHYAHVLSCMAENDLLENGRPTPVLGVAWDGSGYGDDSTLWGGEFLRIADSGFQRVAHLRPFHLPGGELAIKEPRRSALGLLYEAFGESAFTMNELAPIKSFSPIELDVLKTSLKNKINSPATSSIGRLFDAVAGILGLIQQSSFEGQAAMSLEFALLDFPSDQLYNFKLTETNGPIIIDWEPLLKDLLADVRASVPAGTISAKFHNTLSSIIVAVAERAGINKVVLSGGCFQNKYLTEQTIHKLAIQFQPYWHQRIPPNDGGIALGQAVSAFILKKNRD